jgi:hypothetical protein
MPVAAFDDFDRVISIGSLSKVYWGGLRIGWIRANTELVNELTYAKAASDLSCPYVEQRAAADLMTQLDLHLPLVRTGLMQRCRVLCDALEAHFPSWHVPQPCGGVVAWVQAPGLPTDSLARSASRFHLRLVGGSRFSAVGGHTDRLRLPFTLQHEELMQSVSYLAELAAWWTTYGRQESSCGQTCRLDLKPELVAGLAGSNGLINATTSQAWDGSEFGLPRRPGSELRRFPPWREPGDATWPTHVRDELGTDTAGIGVIDLLEDPQGRAHARRAAPGRPRSDAHRRDW